MAVRTATVPDDRPWVGSNDLQSNWDTHSGRIPNWEDHCFKCAATGIDELIVWGGEYEYCSSDLYIECGGQLCRQLLRLERYLLMRLEMSLCHSPVWSVKVTLDEDAAKSVQAVRHR